MKQTIHIRIMKMLSCIAVFSAIVGTCMLAGCNPTKEKTGADLVVYGKIFTSENNQVAESFAVKNGKYVYVGDRKEAEAFVEMGKTEVLDYTGKGLVMPGCGNGHAHYASGFAIQSVGTMVSRDDDVNKFLTETVPVAVKKAKDTGAKAIFGYGWNMMEFPKNMPTRQQLDAICSDIPMYFADEEGHKGLVNTVALVNAGIMKKDGTVLKKEIRGGEIKIGADGTPTGLLSEQAGTYVRSFLDNENLFSVDIARANMATYFEGKKVFSIEAEPTDYSDKNNWMKLPEITKKVDTIYIYPTEYEDDSEGAPVFAGINEKTMREPAQETYLMQGTAYEDATNVFVPYYRQVNMAAASKMTGQELDAAFRSIPQKDVFAALDYYFENVNGGRPFILAGHSQGSAIQSLVLAEYMKDHPEYLKRMVAAYVIGYSITGDYLKANPHLKFAEKADDTGVIVSWNTEGPANVGKDNIVVLPGEVSINPLNWKRDETYASEAQNLGGYIYNEKTGKLEIVPNAADAQLNLKRGVVITKTKALEPISGTTVFGPASYHNGDYALYYNNIKDNVATRIAAYLSK